MLKREINIIGENVSNQNVHLSLSDTKRINGNIELLKNRNIPFFDCKITIPTEENTIIKTKEEIINKMLSSYVLSMSATYCLDNASDLINAAYIKLDEKFNIDRILSLDEKNTILKIIKNDYSLRELEDISWLLEDVSVYMWTLGLIELPVVDKECDVKDINKIIFNMDYNEILNKSKVKSKEEILLFFDLLLRFEEISKCMTKNNKSIKGINELVIHEQISALTWLTSFTSDSKTLQVSFERGNLKFGFVIPANIEFKDIKYESSELFALSSKDNKTKMIMFDMGECNLKELDNSIDLNIYSFMNNGFNYINKYTFSSHNLKSKIYQIVIEKNHTALNSYLFIVSNHLVRLDSLIEYDIDYKDYNSLINSANTNIALDFIFSIVEDYNYNEETKDINHEFDYSNILPTTNSIGELIKYIEQIYVEFKKIVNSNDNDLDYNINIKGLFSDNIVCKSYEEYMSNVESGYLNRVDSIDIELTLNYKKNEENYKNKFLISIKPYDIKFIRTSNHYEENMNEIESSINSLFKRLPISNSIFFTK